jgi:hypothetical protein
MANEIKYRTAVIAKSTLTAESVLRLTSLTASRALILNASGEVAHSATTDTELGYLSGVTSSVQTQLGDKFSKSVDDTDDITEGVSKLFFTDERAQDAVGTILVDSSNIDFTYSDGTPSITADLTNSGVSAGTYGSATQVAQVVVDAKGRITSATNISISGVDTKEIKVSANDSTPGYLEGKVVGASGKIAISTLNDGGDEDLQITIGADVFDKTTDDSGDITEGSNLFFTDERAQDAVGGMVANSSNVSLTYVDGTPSLTADLVNTAVSAGSYGSSSQVGSFTVDAKGRLTAASNVSIDHGSISGLGDDDHTQYILVAGTRAFSGNQSMGGNKLTSLGAPTASSDAATKGYVDSVAEGLKPKTAARVATTANITIATALNSGDSIDGVTLADGDRVLVKDQSTASQNGIYIVGATPARSSDFDSLSPIDEINGALVAVQEGSTHAGKVFVQQGTVATLDTDPITFVFFNSSATLVGGDGITISGSNVSVDHDGQGLQFVATQLSLELDGSTLSKSASGLKLSDTAVSAGSYGSASQVGTFTVDAQGRLTAAASTSISITASQVSDFNEAAQDAVGGALTDSASIDFTYNDGANTITAVVLPAGVDHDSLQNFVANEHIDHSSVVLSGAANGGISSSIGDITASRSISIDITNATAETSAADADLVLIHDASANALRKMTRGNFLSGAMGASPDDISETSFSGSQSASSATVTGFAFANANVRSFRAQVSISIDATSDLFETYDLLGVQKSGSWEMSQLSTGDDTLVTFSINSSGQILYSSSTYAGFASMTIKFRAWSIHV